MAGRSKRTCASTTGFALSRMKRSRRQMTWREFGAYIRQLPADARTRLAVGDEDGIWGLQEHLTAILIDETRNANWQRANEGAPKGKQSPHPKPFPRPGGGGK